MLHKTPPRTFPAGLGFTAFAAALACSKSSCCQFIVAPAVCVLRITI